MKKTITFLLSLSFLLTACGQIDVAEEVPPVVSIETNNEDNDSTLSDENIDDTLTTTTENAILIECESKADSCISDLDSANQRITELQDSLQKMQTLTSQTNQNLNEFFVEYLKNVPQKEFAFDECGRISTLRAKPWFANFSAALSEKNIFFNLAKRPLEANDFFGACSSNNGNMAFFLGAGFSNETEFHLLKYDFNKDLLEIVQIGRDTCEDCPTTFGKRQGPFVELTGDNNTLFRYYFDKNLLMLDSDFQ